MDNRIRLLSLISDGKFHSGEELGRSLSISRTAVWKMISSFSEYGLDVFSIRGKGHRLSRPIEFLDNDQLLFHINPAIRPLIGSLTVHTVTGSTNQCLLEMSGESDFHTHVMLAEFQTAGRGRRGNRWFSPFGAGVSLSVGWQFDSPPEPLTAVSLAAGVAAIDCLEKFGICEAKLKWPNDIHWRDRKLGGILLEMEGESAGPCRIVLGIGINFSFPGYVEEMIDQPWIDIAGIIKPLPSRNAFAGVLISEIMRMLDSLKVNRIPEIIENWRRHDCMKGRQATLIFPGKSIRGKVLGVDNHGHLLMSVNGKICRYSSGEISLKVPR
jgi:BirA family transcriptional regulator, biotin operon repressor / biotin---[acetyl-CoA-carboxylase] ligase